MRFLKPKAILIYLISLFLVVFVLVFIFGGLKESKSSLTAREFDTSMFLSTDEVSKTRALNTQRVIAVNDSYFMTYNEATTVTTIYEINATCPAPEVDEDGDDVNDFSSCTRFYATAVDNNTNPSGDERTTKSSVFIATFINTATSAITPDIYSTANSAYMYDSNLGIETRNTSFSLVDNGIQVLYKIKKNVKTTNAVPKVIDVTTWDEIIRGNVVFKSEYGSFRDRREKGIDGARVNMDCAAWMYENGMGEVAGYYKLGIETQFVQDAADALVSVAVGKDDPERYINQIFMKNIPSDFYDNYLNSEDNPCNTTKYTINYATIYGDKVKDYMIDNDLVNESDFIDMGHETYRTGVFSDDFRIGKHINVLGSPCYSNPYLDFSTIYNVYQELLSENITKDLPRGYIMDGAPKSLDGNMTGIMSTKYGRVYKTLCTLVEAGFDANGDPYKDEYDQIAYNGGLHTYINLINDDGSKVKSFIYKALDGIVAADFDGKYYYLEHNTETDEYKMTDDECMITSYLVPLQATFTRRIIDDINSVYDITFENDSDVYEIGIEYLLTEKGLKASLITSSINEPEGDNILSSIDMFPFFTFSGKTEGEDYFDEGMLVIPDGSGAVSLFTNEIRKEKPGTSSYSESFYGNDETNPREQRPEDKESLMLGMYGFINNTRKKAILAIVEEGAELTTLAAEPFKNDGTIKDGNKAYFRIKLREDEEVKSAGKKFTKYSEGLPKNDFVFNYNFLKYTGSDFDYNDIAASYREYLINKYSLTLNDNTKKNVTYLNVLGAYEKDKLFLGVKYKDLESLTTYSELQSILTEFSNDSSFDKVNVIYRAWTSDALEMSFRSRIKKASSLGNDNELKSLISYMNDNNYGLYPEMSFQTATEYDYFMGTVKYTAKTVGKYYSEEPSFNIATGLPDKRLPKEINMSPKYLESHTNKILSSLSKYDFSSLFIKDLGNRRLGDYSKTGNEIYTPEGENYQTKALDIITNSYDKLVLSKAFDYSFKYASGIVDVPFISTQLQFFDYSIPLYQLVISGLFDYSGISVNNSISKSADWFLLKSIETGSNLQFTISYEDPKVLLDTDYTSFYDTYYINNKENIVNMNKKINDLGIMEGRLIRHKNIEKDINLVTYVINEGTSSESMINIVINMSVNKYNYLGNLVDENSYKIVG